MVGYYVATIIERFVTKCALATLDGNLRVEEFSHFAVGAEFPVSPGMMRVFDAPDSHLALASFSPDCLSAAAEERSVKWTQLIAAESHSFFSKFGFNAVVARDWQETKSPAIAAGSL